MFALQNRAYDVQTVSWERWNIFSKLVYFWSEKCFEDERLHGCVTTWICHISTYTYTHVRHFKLFVRVTKSTCICYQYFMSDSLGVAAAMAAHRISGACASVYSLYFFESTTFVHSTDVSVYSAVFCSFYVIALEAMLSLLYIRNSEYNLNITWSQGKILWHFFLFTSLQYSSKNSCHYFHFQWFFFLQRIQNCLCNVFS